MNSFKFFEKYYKGEYDKYSPFVHCLINVIQKNDFILQLTNNATHEIFDLKGQSIAKVIFNEKQETNKSSGKYLLISTTNILFQLDGRKTEVGIEASLKEITKQIDFFFQPENANKLEELAKYLKEDIDAFLVFFENNTIQKSKLPFLKEVTTYFEEFLHSEIHLKKIKHWIFFHKVISYVLDCNNIKSKFLQDNEIYKLLNKVTKTIEKETNVLNEQTSNTIKHLVEQANSLDILLGYIVKLLNNVSNRINIKLVNNGLEYEIIIKSYWYQYIVESFNKYNGGKAKVLISSTYNTALTFELIQKIDISSKSKFQVCAPGIAEYYLTFLYFEQLQTSVNNIDIKLFDLTQEPPKVDTSKQQSLFNFNQVKNSIPQSNSFDFVITDFSDYPLENQLHKNSKVNASNHKQLNQKNTLLVNGIINARKWLNTDGKLELLINNHLLYNSSFHGPRKLIAKGSAIKLTEVSGVNSLEQLVFLSLENTIREKLEYNDLSIEQLDNPNGKRNLSLDSDNDEWFHNEYTWGIRLFDTTLSSSTSAFTIHKKGAFYNYKKLPPLNYKLNSSTNKVVSKPFGEPLFVSSSELEKKHDAEEKALFNLKNEFICLGRDALGKEAYTIGTTSYPTRNLLNKITCLPLMKGSDNTQEFNITDDVYRIFRAKHIKYIENKFNQSLFDKDITLKECLDKLLLITESLPVLKKFVVILQKIQFENANKRLTAVTIEYSEVMRKMAGKIAVLSKNAKERKRLFKSISEQLTKLKLLLRKYQLEELNCQRELDFLTRENIFYYCYAILNSPIYKEKYSYYLLYDIPRVHYTINFYEWVIAGKKLFKLFNGNPDCLLKLKVIELEEQDSNSELLQVKPMKKLGSILVNDIIEISGIPVTAWDFKIKGKSPLDWKIFDLRKKYKTTKLDQEIKKEIIDSIIIYSSIAVEIQTILKHLGNLEYKLES